MWEIVSNFAAFLENLNFKDKTMMGVVNKLLKAKTLLTSPSNVLPYWPK